MIDPTLTAQLRHLQAKGGAPMSRTTWTLRAPGRPITTNAERRLSPFERARHVKAWRSAFGSIALAERVPLLDAVMIEAHQTVINRRSMPDTGACWPAIKAGIDGLVDVGVLTHDGPDHVVAILLGAPRIDGADALVLTIYARAPQIVQPELVLIDGGSES